MLRTMLQGKIHRARVTEANVNYEGSITIDATLIKAAGILPYEMVHVLDVDNGTRLQTYVIEGESDSGAICINGAAARLVHEGDTVIILSYCQMDDREALAFRPNLVYVDNANAIKHYVRGGQPQHAIA
ncbi:MAG: aspartate 1-decarboxylase [Chloroflexi bacterium]|nr:aspartate 1-decarboxylase [Chloroflexota bacterium]